MLHGLAVMLLVCRWLKDDGVEERREEARLVLLSLLFFFLFFLTGCGPAFRAFQSRRCTGRLLLESESRLCVAAASARSWTLTDSPTLSSPKPLWYKYANQRTLVRLNSTTTSPYCAELCHQDVFVKLSPLRQRRCLSRQCIICVLFGVHGGRAETAGPTAWREDHRLRMR